MRRILPPTGTVAGQHTPNTRDNPPGDSAYSIHHSAQNCNSAQNCGNHSFPVTGDTDAPTFGIIPGMQNNFKHFALLFLFVGATAPSTAGVFYKIQYIRNNVGDIVAERRYTNDTSYVERTYEYDAFGRKTKETDEVGNTLHITYDAIGNIVEMRGSTYPIRCSYDTRGNLRSLFTTKDGVTWHETKWIYYSPYILPSRKEFPDGTFETYTYYPFGQEKRTVFADGNWKEVGYDTHWHRSSVTYSTDSTPSVFFENDPYGNVTAVSNSLGYAWRYSLTAGGTMTNENVHTHIDANFVRPVDRYARALGFVLQRGDGKNQSALYTYDREGRFASMAYTNHAGRSFTVEYGYLGTYPNGWTLVTDAGGVLRRTVARERMRRELVVVCATVWNETPLGAFFYMYDAAARTVRRNEDTFAYGARNELAEATVGTNRIEHAYDDSGNQLVHAVNSETNRLASNALNQLTNIVSTVASRTLEWTMNGNLASDGVWQYTYDLNNKPVLIAPISAENGSRRIRSEYDYAGRRTRKTVEIFDGTTWTVASVHDYLYDGWNIVQEEIADAAGAQTVCKQFFWGLDIAGTLQSAGGVGALMAVSIGSAFYFPVYDAHGNIVKYVDETGATVAAFEYDDFGRTLARTGSMADAFPHGHSTKYTDIETGIVDYGLRPYAPHLRVWMTRDPAGERAGINLYEYLMNNAVTYIDGFGDVTVKVVTTRENNIWQRMRSGEKTTQVEVKNVMDIGIEPIGQGSSVWGHLAVPERGKDLFVDDCEIIIYAGIQLREDLDLQGDRNTTYFYTPHTPSGRGGGASSSTGRPQIRGAILAHERGHASAYLDILIPKFKAELQKFGNRKLSESDKAEVRRIYDRCKREAQEESSRRANEAHENWYRNNGYNIEIRR